MPAPREALIIDGMRSPRGRGKPGVGSLSDIHPQRIMAQVLNGLKDKVGFDPADVEDVIAGNGSGVGDHAHDIARLSVLDAGWPITAPGVTLHRFCGSGQQSVNFAAMAIQSGHQDLVIGGGVESMSRYAPNHTDGFTANNAHLFEQYPLIPQGISADLIATLEGFSREDCDRYGVRSQERSMAAIEDGRFNDSLVPIYQDSGELALDRDEHPRPGTTLESLAGLSASFEKMGKALIDGQVKTFDEICSDVYPEVSEVNHVHHAGNSSGVVDGASAILLSSDDYAKAHGLKPRARIVMSATAGTEPVIMLTAPGPAAEICLKKAGMKSTDIDLYEVNEAFAPVPMAWMKATGGNHEKLNVNGGAIALGHPLGASGTKLMATLLHALKARGKRYGLQTMCEGGGLANVTIVESI